MANDNYVRCKPGELTDNTFNRLAGVTKFHQLNIIKNNRGN
ncbi:uncharacterized protein METZ01_LOCUS500018, partial [marine metagenome]